MLSEEAEMAGRPISRGNPAYGKYWRTTDNKETDMSRCCCRFVLAVLVIVFAWWRVSWANIALTVLGALLAVLALTGACCCASMCKDKNAEPETEDQQEAAD